MESCSTDGTPVYNLVPRALDDDDVIDLARSRVVVTPFLFPLLRDNLLTQFSMSFRIYAWISTAPASVIFNGQAERRYDANISQ